MIAFLWSLYILIFLASLLAIIFLIMSQGYEALSLPQLLYLGFVYFTLAFGVALQAFPRWVLPVFICALPPVGFAINKIGKRIDEHLEQSLLSDELHRVERYLTENPTDAFPFQQMAELYEKTGDLPLAAACYEQALRLSDKKAIDQDKYRPRLKRIQQILDKTTLLQGPTTGLRACPSCGEINHQSVLTCPRCSQTITQSQSLSWMQKASIFLCDDILLAIATGGAIALPFRITCGPDAFVILWGISGFALWLWISASHRMVNR